MRKPIRTELNNVHPKETSTETACLIIRDKERLENYHIEINYSFCYPKPHSISGPKKIKKKIQE